MAELTDNLYKTEKTQYSDFLDMDEVGRIRTQVINDVAGKLSRMDDVGGDDSFADSIILRSIEAFNNIDMEKNDRLKLLKEVKSEVYGFGPIQRLIDDDALSEIMVNGPKQVYIEHRGHLMLTDVSFDDNAHVRKIIDRIVNRTGRHIDDANPMVDTRLPDGSRVNATIPPISLISPTLTIRKFAKIPLTVKNLLEYGTLNEKMAAFLEAAVGRGRLNVLVSGGTGSGKTTLLNVLSEFIPNTERIITIEDAAELKLKQSHVLSMEARPSNIEGTGEITIRALVKNALRQRPDRIIVGEVRAGEAVDMLQAMNTGHDGSLTTIHANSPRDALSRVETTTLMSGMQIPVSAIRQQCAGAFDLIVHTERFRDGSRKITSITDVGHLSGDIISLQEIFRFVHDGEGTDPLTGRYRVLGHFEATGVYPGCCEKMQDNGAAVDRSWFRTDSFTGRR